MIELKQINSSFEFLRTWFLGSSSWRGWDVWNISHPNYLHLKQLLWAALTDSQRQFALALLCFTGSGQGYSSVVLGGICRQLRVIYPEEWSKLGKKKHELPWQSLLLTGNGAIFQKLKTVKISISNGHFLCLKSHIITVLVTLLSIISNHCKRFVSYLLFHLGKFGFLLAREGLDPT